MSVDIRHDRFRNIVGDDLEFTQLDGGFLFTEGPVWHPYARHLIFSDSPGDHMRRWGADAGVETFRRPSNMANGNAYDRGGRLITCEHATSRVTRTEADGTITVLASHYEGKELNSPNDVVVKSDGAIYFTDPVFGRREFFGVPREQELSIQGVYRIEPDGKKLQLLADDFEQPNGLCFSVDETRMFINDTPRGHIRVFDMATDGGLRGGEVWAEVTGEGEGVADGLKTDSEENVYCTGPGGIHVFDRRANCLGVIRIPEKTANFNWGGDDMLWLFVTASTSLYRLRVKVPGKPSGFDALAE